MTNSIDIWNELKALSPLLAGVEKINVFTVPSGYFDNLSEDILVSVKEETGALLQSVPAPERARVPEGYFESLADTILNKIKAQDTAAAELKALSPMLYSIQNGNVYTVPQGYFEKLTGNIINAAVPQQAKVVTMGRRSSWFKYTVAAAFAGVMMFGAYKFIGTADKITPAEYSNWVKTDVDNELAKISDEAVVKFLTKEGVDVDAAVAVSQMQDKVDTDETVTDKKESEEIDELFNQLDDNKTMN